MVNFMVERATSEVLIGPDWAKNTEICEILNHNPRQVKDVVKGIKKKLKSKNSKVQFLALTLLEAMISNCGDIVHMHVADRNILPEMVKIFKKRSDFSVKEKILILVDTWQEAFGGVRARYPQYFAAYQDLLRAGAIFPRRTERPPPYPRNIGNSGQQQEMDGSSAEPEFPTLSSTEIESVRAIMNVLAEMLSALDPGNKEGLKQEVLVDLVEQCRTYKQRVVHLVNSTSDESLLGQGLALNDDLQRVLAKHQSLALGTSFQADKQMPEPANADCPLVDTGDISNQSNERSISGAAGSSQPGSIPIAAANCNLDLLSFDDDNSPEVDNSLALVPLGEPQQTTPGPHNALVPFDMFSDPYTQGLPGQTNPWTPQTQQQQRNFHVNGTAPNMQSPQYEQSYDQGTGPAWNSQMDQQQQAIVPFYEVDNSLALVPLGEPQQTTPGPHNALVPFDMFFDSYTQGLPGQTNPWTLQTQQQQQRNFHVNGTAPNMQSPQYEQSYDQGTCPAWNSQMDQQQQAIVPFYEVDNSLALVPLGEPQHTIPGPHNALVPFDMFSDSYTQGLPGQTNPWTPQTQQQKQQQNFLVNGTAPNMQSPQYEQSYDQGTGPAWNSQMDQQQQATVPFYGTQCGFTLPPPPWEAQEEESSPVEVPQYPQSQYHMGSDQGNHFAAFHPHQNQGAQYVAMVPYQLSGGQMASYPQQMYGNPQMGASGYGQQQYLDQQMHGLSIRDDNGYQVSSSFYVPRSSKPSKPEDKMFGDLVDMAKVKSTATTPGTAGNM